MNESEARVFFEWAEEHLKGFTVEDCEESTHYYLNGVLVGGWAGDTRQTFYKQNDELAKGLRMFDAYNKS
ncbi:hypothetical protein [Vibrio sp. TRT 29B02]|uniref:hypothetical protein n=1 Tax=Vibrio sp. TRT 29B02 TaxID=3418508 RepID=UPI003CF8E6D4